MTEKTTLDFTAAQAKRKAKKPVPAQGVRALIDRAISEIEATGWTVVVRYVVVDCVDPDDCGVGADSIIGMIIDPRNCGSGSDS